MGLFGETSRAATLNIWRDTPVVVCLSFWNSPGLAFYRIPKARRIQLFWLPGKEVISTCMKLFHGAFLFFSCQGKIALGTSSFFSFTFSCFFLSIPPSALLFWAVLTPLKHSTSLSVVFVYIRFPANKCARALFGSQAITHLRYTEDLVFRVFSPRASN